MQTRGYAQAHRIRTKNNVPRWGILSVSKGANSKRKVVVILVTYYLVLFYSSTRYHQNILKGIPVTEQTGSLFQTKQREITPKVRKQELSFLYPTRRLVLFYISTKYHKTVPKGLRLTERTQNQWIITVRHNKGR